ncbi:hypothetical protein LXL04_035831 [Taraxacum kok-saghyz]
MNEEIDDSFENPRGQDYGHGDLEIGTQNNPNTAKLGLDDFFKKVQAIEKQYEKLNKLLKKLQMAHEESKAVTKAAAMKDRNLDVEKELELTGQELQLQCNLSASLYPNFNNYSLTFKDKMSEFQALRESIHQEHREIFMDMAVLDIVQFHDYTVSLFYCSMDIIAAYLSFRPIELVVSGCEVYLTSKRILGSTDGGVGFSNKKLYDVPIVRMRMI